MSIVMPDLNSTVKWSAKTVIFSIYDYAQMNQKYRYPVITAVKV